MHIPVLFSYSTFPYTRHFGIIFQLNPNLVQIYQYLPCIRPYINNNTYRTHIMAIRYPQNFPVKDIPVNLIEKITACSVAHYWTATF